MSELTTQARRAADELREWLTWAGKHIDGVPKPQIVDRIEADAREQVLDERRIREAIAYADEGGSDPDDWELWATSIRTYLLREQP